MLVSLDVALAVCQVSRSTPPVSSHSLLKTLEGGRYDDPSETNDESKSLIIGEGAGIQIWTSMPAISESQLLDSLPGEKL